MPEKSRKELLEEYKRRKVVGCVYAVTNKKTGRALVLCAQDMGGIRQRYEFAVDIGSCFHPKLQQDVKTYGVDAFEFSVLEELTKKETQTDRDFADDLETLRALWLEKYDPAALY